MVIDTQSFVWMNIFPSRLTESAKTAIQKATMIHLPAIALWEIAMLSSRKRVEFGLPIQEWLDKAIAQPKIQLVAITPAIAATSVSLEMHGDPADRLVVATALCLDIPLITSDRKIRNSGLVHTVW